MAEDSQHEARLEDRQNDSEEQSSAFPAQLCREAAGFEADEPDSLVQTREAEDPPDLPGVAEVENMEQQQFFPRFSPEEHFGGEGAGERLIKSATKE